MDTNIKNQYLKLITNDFEEFSKLILIQIRIVQKLLDTKVQSLFEDAEKHELSMDQLDLTIRDRVVFAILQFNPKGEDLRFIITYYDMTIYLERIGDLLLNIIHFIEASDTEKESFTEFQKRLTKMTLYVEDMVKSSIFSFANKDSKEAYNTIDMDDRIDNYFRKINSNLQDTFSDRALTNIDIKNILNISGISQNLERIGDHAANIAEATVFLVDGKDIRHQHYDE